ncbi:Desumoylating isopeptidase 1 homolog (DeSI-1) (Polyubiquitinated substrate transporter) (POST), partial [Durusdinium trenchii]
IGQREYTFSNSGVMFHTPFEAGAEAKFKETIQMGSVESMSEVNAAVARLRAKFAPGSYNLVRQNCVRFSGQAVCELKPDPGKNCSQNHFSNALVNALTGKSIPSYINRSARLGSSFAPKDTLSEDAKGAKAKPKKASPPPKQASTERPNLSDKQRAMLDKLKADKEKKRAAKAKALAEDDSDVDDHDPDQEDHT